MNDRLPGYPPWITNATIYDMVINKRNISAMKRKEKKRKRPPITDKREATHGRVLGPP